MTDAQTTSDDERTDGKTTRIVHAHIRTDGDESENGSSTIDPKNGGKED